MARNKKDPGKLLSSAVMLFYFSAFLLIACKDYAWQGFALALAVPAMIWIGTNLLPRLFPSDRLLLSLTNFLSRPGRCRRCTPRSRNTPITRPCITAWALPP